jgi:Zn-finger nucleic acid-binding protein
MNCPSCSRQLVADQHENVAIHTCPGCAGCFLGFNELRTVLESETSARSDVERAQALEQAGTASTTLPDTRADLQCPSCVTPMRRYVHQYSSGTWIDACEEHGIWLDAGELARLEAYAEAVRCGGIVATPHSNVGLEPARITTTPDAVEEMLASRSSEFDDRGSVADLLLGPDGFAIAETVMSTGSEVLRWRRRDKDVSKREQAVLDAAREAARRAADTPDHS